MAEPDRTLYLVKADDRLHSSCRCAQGLAGFPIQADCPWCGCGWLFTCARCGKPFTFARAEWIPVDLEAIARLNLGLADRLSPGASPTPEAIHGWVERMRLLLEPLKPGREYVYLDGAFLPAHADEVRLEGWFARHELSGIPQVQALEEPQVLHSTLLDPGYWQARAIR